MPLYMLVRPKGKGGKSAKPTNGLQDYMHGRAKRAPPCYVAEAPQQFDEKGKELGPDAQVWKTYVREADLVDGELVDGWNKSMDVILIFAALFSAISTAFVIESYKSLKQDPADLSSQTLLTISQTLMLIANGSQPSNALPNHEAEAPVFKASAKAICVNLLWFLSLSLSVAVSLIAMLAKEWCLEYMSGRTGPPEAQARRRQQRWDGLVKWRMKGLLMLLPSLIHVSLLFFAIGLCVFLWDVHYGVAIPVVAVTALAAGTYFSCTIMPFLYDYCPYGTVLSRFVKQSKAYQSAKQYVLLQLIKHPKLSQLAKRLMTTNTQPRRDDVPQDEVTANALSWMIVNCETPRSVDVALQSLAAADESLPTTVLEKCHAWTKIKQRLEYVYMENQSEQSRIGSELYARALEVYPITRRKIDMLGYAYYPLDYVRREERLVLGIQATIQSILDEVLLRIDPKDTTTIQLLNRCAAIGQYHLSHKFSLLYATEDTRERYRVLVEPHTLANDLVNRLEECPRRDFTLYSDMHRALSASLTFLVCCSAAEGLTAGTNTTYALRLIRGYASVSNAFAFPVYASPRPIIAPYLALASLRLFMSPISPDDPWRNGLRPEFDVFDYLWATLMTVAHLDSSALKRLDFTYLTYGMWYLLTSPSTYNLSRNDCVALQGALDWTSSANGSSTKVQSIYHAYYIHRLSHDIITMAETDAFSLQVMMAGCYLQYYSPWDDDYLLPTTEIYVLTLKYLCTTSDATSRDSWNAHYILKYSPIPKCSPQLAQQLSSSDLITHLSDAMCSRDCNTQLFVITQLWLFLDMALHEADRQSPTLNALEVELLKYSGLGNDLEKQEAIAGELETKLMALLDHCDSNPTLQIYAYRVLEVMLQRRFTPLPEIAHIWLKGISERLRGIESFVNYETERSVAYPDLVFDSEGRPVSSSKE